MALDFQRKCDSFFDSCKALLLRQVTDFLRNAVREAVEAQQQALAEEMARQQRQQQQQQEEAPHSSSPTKTSLRLAVSIFTPLPYFTLLARLLN